MSKKTSNITQKQTKKETLSTARKRIHTEAEEHVEAVTTAIKKDKSFHKKLTDNFGAKEYEAALAMHREDTESSCAGTQKYLVDRLCPTLEKIKGITNIFEFTRELTRKLVFFDENSVGVYFSSSLALMSKFKKFSRPSVEKLSSHEKILLQEAYDLFCIEHGLCALLIRGTWQKKEFDEKYDFNDFITEVATQIEAKLKPTIESISKDGASPQENSIVSKVRAELDKTTLIASLLNSHSSEEIANGIGCLSLFFAEIICETFEHLKCMCNVFQLALDLFPEISKKTGYKNIFPSKNKYDSKQLSEIKSHLLKYHTPCMALVSSFWHEEKNQNLHGFTRFILETTKFANQKLKEKIDLSEGTEDKSEQFLVTNRLALGSTLAQAMILWNINCNIFELILILFPALSKVANIPAMKVKGYFNEEKKFQLASKKVKDYLESKHSDLLKDINEICKKGYSLHLLRVFIEQTAITAKVIMDQGRIKLKFDNNQKVEMPAMFGATLTD